MKKLFLLMLLMGGGIFLNGCDKNDDNSGSGPKTLIDFFDSFKQYILNEGYTEFDPATDPSGSGIAQSSTFYKGGTTLAQATNMITVSPVSGDLKLIQWAYSMPTIYTPTQVADAFKEYCNNMSKKYKGEIVQLTVDGQNNSKDYDTLDEFYNDIKALTPTELADRSITAIIVITRNGKQFAVVYETEIDKYSASSPLQVFQETYSDQM